MDLVFTQGNEVLTTSRKIAEAFGREHKNVIRIILEVKENIEKLSSHMNQLTFEPIEYVDSKGRSFEEFNLKRKEAILIIMRLQGPEALKVQVSFVEAFEKMERMLRGDFKPINQVLPTATETLKAIEAAASLFGLTGNQKILSVNRATREITNVDFQQLLGIELVNDTQEIQLSPTEIGKELGLSAKKVNKLLQEKNLQIKDINNNWVPTLQGSKLAVILDVGKKHSNGTPITQLKWKQSVINELRQ